MKIRLTLFWLVAVVLMGITPISTLAQHSATLSWTASTTPASSYFVYRAPNATGTFVKLNATAQTQLTYTDTTVAACQSYAYNVTAIAAGFTESVPSNVVTATIPGCQTNPPTNLSITQVALNHLNSNRDEVVAVWLDDGVPSKTSYVLMSDNRFLKRGTLQSTNGGYTVTWRGSKLLVPAVLLVCNTSGTCVSRVVAL